MDIWFMSLMAPSVWMVKMVRPPITTMVVVDLASAKFCRHIIRVAIDNMISTATIMIPVLASEPFLHALHPSRDKSLSGTPPTSHGRWVPQLAAGRGPATRTSLDSERALGTRRLSEEGSAEGGVGFG